MTRLHPCNHAQATPEKTAYLFAHPGGVDGARVTYRELEDRSNQAAQLLRARGVGKGGHIAMLMLNEPTYFELTWAAQRSGIIYTCISTRLTPAEIAYILNDCHAQAVFVSSSLDVAAQLRRREDLAHIQHWFSTPGAVEGYEAYESARAAMPAERIADESPGLNMLYSSGTTGRPKGVKGEPPEGGIDSDNPLRMLQALLYGFDENAVYLSPAPLYHAAPLRYNMTNMLIGGTSIVMERFDPEDFLRLVQRHKVTHAQLVPTMFSRMLKLPEEVRARYDVSSLRYAIHAAAPCPVPVKEAMIEWWGPVIYEYYAGTEGNGFCSITSEEWLAHKGSVGRAMLGQLRIADEDGRLCAPGETGTVYFEGGPGFEYHNDPDKTASSRNEHGWSTLGDMGYMDEEGYLYLTDRKSFMIISGGVNIYPQEAENRLVVHPKVGDAAVFGVPHAEFGEEVKAVVEPLDPAAYGLEPGAEPAPASSHPALQALEAELIAYCKEELADIKCPRSVDFTAQLPRHPTGKLYKRLLRDKYWEGRATKIV